MKRLLTGLLGLLALAVPAVAQVSQGPTTVAPGNGVIISTDIVSGGQRTLLNQVRINGGLLADFRLNNFAHQVAGGAFTQWNTFSDMFTALSGSASSSVKWMYNSSGVLVQFSANTPAAPCYDGNGTLQGLCTEMTATNSLLRSADFTNASWTKTGVVNVANNRTAPDGTATGSTITESAANTNHWVIQSVTKAASALRYNDSCHFAPGIGNRNVVVYADDNAGNGAWAVFSTTVDDTAASIAPLATGTIGTGFTLNDTFVDNAGTSTFRRYSLNYTSNSAVTLRLACGLALNTSFSYTGDAVSAIAIWGAEHKQNTTGATQTVVSPSSYIPTTTVSVTRAIDRLVMTLPADMVSLPAYAGYVNVNLPRRLIVNTATLMSLGDPTDTDLLSMVQSGSGSSSLLSVRILNTGTTTNVIPTGPIAPQDQAMGLAANMSSGNYWVENTGQSIKASNTVQYPTLLMGKVRFSALSPTATNGTQNIGLTQMALFPKVLPIGTLKSILFPNEPYNPDTIVPPNYFTQAMINSVTPAGMKVWRLGAMPPNDSQTPDQFPYFPGTYMFNQNLIQYLSSASTQMSFTWFPWGLRCDLCANAVNRKPNFFGPLFYTSSGKQARGSFTTYTKAMYAQYAQYLKAYGYPDHAAGPCAAGMDYCGYLDALSAGGISTVYDYATAAANADAIFTVPNDVYMTAIDIMVWPQTTLSTGLANHYGTMCDCEFSDNRAASDVQWLMGQLAHVLQNKGYKFAIFANDLLRAGIQGGYCGIGIVAANCDVANLNTIATAVDHFLVAVSEPPPTGYTFNTALPAKAALFGAVDPSHLVLSFGLGVWPGGATIADATFARSYMVSNAWGGVQLIPLYNVPGGGQCRYTNLTIEIMLGLSTGSCTIPSP